MVCVVCGGFAGVFLGYFRGIMGVCAWYWSFSWVGFSCVGRGYGMV